MKASVIVFPGSNCDRDIKVALEGCGADVEMLWHADSALPETDLVVVPGGFSYGDYLRSGSMSANSPIMEEVKSFASKGGHVLGICNGFQILTEAGLLPGTLMRNSGIKFICKDSYLSVENNQTLFSKGYGKGEIIRIPIAHHDGNYFIDDAGLADLYDNEQVAFKYTEINGSISDDSNPNGSIDNIAGIYNKDKNILGMMPHPERLWEDALGGTDGRKLFETLVNSL